MSAHRPGVIGQHGAMRRGPLTSFVSALGTLTLVLALAACGSTPPPSAVAAGLSDNGKTVTLSHRQHLVVTLPGGPWRFSVSPPFGLLSEVSSEQITGGASGNARAGTRETATFDPGRPGGATVSACRGACPKSGSGYVLHVVVTR